MFTNALTYYHELPGRLRVRLPEIEGDALHAAEVADGLRQVEGVTHAQTKGLTGSILVEFDPDALYPEEIVVALKRLGYLHRAQGPVWYQQPPALAPGGYSITGAIASTALDLAVEALVKKAILALL